MLRRHYAPSRPLRLNAAEVRPGEALLGFGPESDPAALNLSRRGDLLEAAANLFAMLRELDRAAGYTGIAVAPIPEAGLGVAINDRLRRAAAPLELEDLPGLPRAGTSERFPASLLTPRRRSRLRSSRPTN